MAPVQTQRERTDGAAPPARRAGQVRRRPSPAVYRRRRLVALLVLLLVLAAAVAGGRALWRLATGDGAGPAGAQQAAAGGIEAREGGAVDGDAARSEGPDAAEGGSAPGAAADGEAADGEAADGEASDDLVAADLEPCAPDAVQVLAAADAAGYDAGEQPVLSAVVRARNGAEPCAVTLGPQDVELVVSSDGERVYDSGHCASGGDAEPAVVAPGRDARADVTWGREHSAPGCPSGMPAAAPGSYLLTATVNGVVSEPLELTLQ